MLTIRKLILTIIVALAASQRNVDAQHYGELCPQAPCHVDAYSSLWIPILPNYQAGAISTPGGTQNNAFDDGQSTVGLRTGIRGMHRFFPTRTLMEFDASIAGADSFGTTETIVPGAGNSVLFPNLPGSFAGSASNPTFSLDSNVFHYAAYAGLRDRFNLSKFGLGMFDVGFGISHMGFDQDFSLLVQDVAAGVDGEYHEDLDTDFLGGEIRSTANYLVRNRIVKVDFNVGIYDMDATYSGFSQFRSGGSVVDQSFLADTLKKTTATVELGIRSNRCFRGVLIRPGVSYKYFTDMPMIEHSQFPGPTSTRLSTDSAHIVMVNLDILLK